MYVESILALQKKASADEGKPVELELVIMTSDDTHSRTQDLLDDHGYFGMQRNQLHLLKQEKVRFVHSTAFVCIHCLCMCTAYTMDSAPGDGCACWDW